MNQEHCALVFVHNGAVPLFVAVFTVRFCTTECCKMFRWPDLVTGAREVAGKFSFGAAAVRLALHNVLSGLGSQ